MNRARRGSAGRVLAATVGLLALAACAKSLKPPGVTADRPGTPVDSVTVALWRMDETGGTLAADAGPSRLDATAGPDTPTIFGRFRGARSFESSANSFLFVPYSPLLEAQTALSIEAWIAPNAFVMYPAAAPIAVRWSPTTNDRSWAFALTGTPGPALPPQPDWLQGDVESRRLAFGFQPDGAGSTRTFYSQSEIELQRWTHVAVTFDGQVVRFFVDGQPDGTFATDGRIRASQAPLLVGNYFDTRLLTNFTGDLRQGPTTDTPTWYALDGGIDELRISRAARTVFPLHGGR
jgi:hypothetical protein